MPANRISNKGEVKFCSMEDREMILELEQCHDGHIGESDCTMPDLCKCEAVRERFGQVTRPLLHHLLGHARSILNSDDLAWDAVQEALIGLWEKIQCRSNVLDYAESWLCRAVVLRSLQIARQNRRRVRHEANATAHRSATIEGSSRSESEAEECQRLFDLAIKALPEDFRAVIELQMRCEMDYAATARQLGIPIGTVRSRLHRARTMLRTILNSATCCESSTQRCPVIKSTPTHKRGRPALVTNDNCCSARGAESL